MGTSRTVLTEKLKSLTGMTPWAFILDVRLTVACKHMTENKDNIRINELAFSVGFNDPKYFSVCFSNFLIFLRRNHNRIRFIILIISAEMISSII